MKAKINRRKIIELIVDIPKDADKRFWQKEMVLLKRLEKKFSVDFLSQIPVDAKVPTIAFYFSDWKIKSLEEQYKEYYYSSLHQKDLSTEQKIGKDVKIKKVKNIKQFLS